MAHENSDEFFMARAVRLAGRGVYGAHPNPMVGAVIVKNGRITGEGWHREFGGAHAEVNAIGNSGIPVRGAALYVTLEPCSTRGKTPPCTEAIIKAGIKRVVIGASDPNPLNGGRAAKILKAAGMEVVTGILKKECERINPAFNKLMKEKLPYVTLKCAQSFDGKTADFRGRSRWISSEEARIEVHKLRAGADAVLAGINTVLADDPMLNVRHIKVKRHPMVIVLDSALKIPPAARLFKNEKVLIATTKKASLSRAVDLNRTNVKVLVLPQDKNGKVDLRALLKELAGDGIGHLFVEGGGTVTGSFVSQGLADRFISFFSPLVIGGEKSKSSVIWADSLNASRRKLGIGMRFENVKRIGPDVMIEAVFSG